MGKSRSSPLVGIIGGGVAGMSCALWLTQFGHQAVIIERGGQLGGQLLGIDRVNHWVLGLPGLTSAEMAKRYADHIAKTSVSVCFNSRLLAIEALPDGYQVRLSRNSQSQTFPVQAIVIATGVRALGAEMFSDLPGFTAAYQSGLVSFFPLDHLDKLAALNGQQVAVIGGGDNAHFTAKDAALAGAHVHLILRSPAKAQPTIRAEVSALACQGLITEHSASEVTGFRLRQNGIDVALKKNNHVSGWLSVDRLFVRIGFAANSGFLDGFAAFAGLHKQGGYIVTDAAKRTNLPWLYAIGDVANSKHQSVVVAIADGAVAAQDFSGRKTG